MISLNPLSGPAPIDQRAELGKAARQFEAIFVRQMLAAARKASLGESLFDSSASEQFRTMQDSQLADLMAEQGGLGLAKTIEQQLSSRIGVGS
jgi:peptidoglycan hydrolase FlgJ